MQVPTLSWLEDEIQAAAAPTPASGGAAPTTLDLSNRQLTHASLRLLPGTLTCLDLTRCGMESLEALARLPRLELLNVSYNRLASLDALQHSRGLKVLFARSNRITSLAALESLPVLQSLDLECNALDTLDALRPLRTGPHTVWARRRGPQSHPLFAPPEPSPRRLPWFRSYGCNPAHPNRNPVCIQALEAAATGGATAARQPTSTRRVPPRMRAAAQPRAARRRPGAARRIWRMIGLILTPPLPLTLTFTLIRCRMARRRRRQGLRRSLPHPPPCRTRVRRASAWRRPRRPRRRAALSGERRCRCRPRSMTPPALAARRRLPRRAPHPWPRRSLRKQRAWWPRPRPQDSPLTASCEMEGEMVARARRQRRPRRRSRRQRRR